ncbi:NCS2 family permease [Bacillus sp. JJ1474]|uniref:NCS2 family permease n=1 Tax=Bacillus sp. JJ1474 TaxID=3122955 RepID=UPI002FFF423D
MSGQTQINNPHNLKPVGRDSWLERRFRLSERNTNVKTEILTGITTFVTMAYIIFVNPSILADAGIPMEAAVAATIYASIIGTILYAFWANLPIAVAPAMGLNVFFTYTVVIGEGLSWQTALGAVFISGIAFLILTITGIRKKLITAIPPTLRSAIGVGIGLMIAYIGLQGSGIIIANEETYVALGNIKSSGPLLAIVGLIIAAVLTAKRIKGAFLISIIGITALAMIFGEAPVPQGIGDIVSLSFPSLADTFLQMDILGALSYGLFSIIFTFTIVELFENLGTLVGLGKVSGLMKNDGDIKNINRALTADAVATMASASMGSTATCAYIESAAGIAEGGKTGLNALTVAILFFAALFFTPFVTLIPTVATAPILIMVGVLMLTEVQYIKFDDYTEIVPAFLTMIMMPLTVSTAEGLAFGFVSYTILKLLTGRAKELHWMMYFITIAFLIHFLVK